ncbi:hypothetical protein BGZ76_006209 [Entomortierella beljakovae]|nr:hypothetical protein BGZ76_006209 [Entomortierella beljakovae]
MSGSTAISMRSCTDSSSRLLFYLRSKAVVAGKRTPSISQCQQRRFTHSWISGHPHSSLYKSSSSIGKSNKTNSSSGIIGPGMSGTHCNGSWVNNGGNSSTTSPSTFLDFAGNSRYQSYNLARFSTSSVALSSSSSSTKAQDSARDTQTQNQTSSSNFDKAHSNPEVADTQSPSIANISATNHQDDKEDDWAVNESFSGYGASFSPSKSESSQNSPPNEPSTLSISHSSDSNTDNNNADYEPSKAAQPALSSFKSPVTIEADWRRTSDTLPLRGSTPINTPLSSSNIAGGLDLSSSTLVQQMLFKERAPHSDSNKAEVALLDSPKQGNSTKTHSQPIKADFAEWDDEDHSIEKKRSHA